MRLFLCYLTALILCQGILHSSPATADDATSSKDVSYYKEVRPILQAHCQGCHQPAKPGGDYVLTTFDKVMTAGESEEPAVVPGKPEESYLLSQITPHEGEAEMPKGAKPLSKDEILLVRTWIQQGAIDDTPENAYTRYDAEHPPEYSAPPVITSLDFSPDGSILAISGFHEVILRSADGSELLGRLVGLSERIESVTFSPDGKRLAVAGGQPGRMGELQIWDVASRTLEHSIPVTFDTIYGASWSPDGKIVAVGCSDSTVRGFDSTTGQEVFFSGAHDDWALDTIFSKDGSLLVSVGRDMSTKLYNIETQRFIDNVTSITPGALKGGILAVSRHPEQDVILVGGSDGIPRIYRMERITKRVIGDDANLIRRFPEMQGRVYSVAFSPDGKSVACGSSLNGQGQVVTYSADFGFEMPNDIQTIVQKVASTQKPEEVKRLEEYVTADVKVLTETAVPAGTYAVAYRPDGQELVAAGTDGHIRRISAADGTVIGEFLPIEVTSTDSNQETSTEAAAIAAGLEEKPIGEETLPSGRQLTAVEVTPTSLNLNGPFSYEQLLVTGILDSGDRIDLTRMATCEPRGNVVAVSEIGRVHAQADGKGELTVTFGDFKSTVPVEVRGVAVPEELSFIRDVNPVLTRVGCNQGTCHGAKDGKNGFKLSLRGYDPIYDVRAFTDDVKCRRTNVASAENSLMLLKASGAVPHVGGQLCQPGEPYYEVIRTWIDQGAKLDQDVERAVSIEVQPNNPVIQALGSRQQFRVVATYSNGDTRDVTREAYLESGNTEVAEVSRSGIVTAIRRGEAPILARFEGNYAAVTLTAMGDREGFAWEEPEVWTHTDELVAAKWKRMKIQPSGLCPDDVFLRRVYLDLTGLPPSAEETAAFLADSRPLRQKREEVIDRLIGSPAFVEYWTNKWADLLQVNSKFLGPEGAKNYRQWIREKIEQNTPYDDFCHAVLTAEGSNKANPPASYYKILREPDAMMENTTHLFLGIRFNCNKCHDHPFERWTQDQYYQTAAFFAQVDLKRDPENKDGNIGGSAVEEAQPMWEVVFEDKSGEVKHDRTGEVTPPLVPYDRELEQPGDSRREHLAAWITSAENDYFARSYVNRVWGYLMGVGLIEPLDDIRAGNPPSNPELLDKLTSEFIESGFDVRQLMRSICTSRTYQLDVATNAWNEDDKLNYSHAYPKRLPAEVLYDSVYSVTGAKMAIPGVPEGTRAAALPDVAIGLDDGFLANLGRPVRESACECERSSDLQLGPVMALMNGATVSQAISQPDNAVETLVKSTPDNSQLIEKLFMRILNRSARPNEVQATVALLDELNLEHQQLAEELRDYVVASAPERVKMENARMSAIIQTKKELDAYQEEIRPRVEAEQKAHQEKLELAKKTLDERITSIDERQVAWEPIAIQSSTPWLPVLFDSVKSTDEDKIEQRDDLSVFVSKASDNAVEYVLKAKSPQTMVTAIRLEVMTDEKLTDLGPGYAKDGNFILREFSVAAISADSEQDGDQKVVKLKNPVADVENSIFKAATLIDGDVNGIFNGWSIGKGEGKNHYVTFEFNEPLDGSTLESLQFKLFHTGGKQNIGRFRISLTSVPVPVDFGVPDHIQDLLAISVESRTDEQKTIVRDYFVSKDTELEKLKASVAEAEKPLPEDPHLVELRNQYDLRKQPLPEDPQMARLKRAVELSSEQLLQSRLTMAQDLTWALINSPAFLFNH